MKIVESVQLDFNDVLLQPKRSNLTSRKDVVLYRSFVTPHSKKTITTVPIIAANMDTVGTMGMAKKMSQHGMMTCLHKHYDVQELKNFYTESNSFNIFYTLGTSLSDLEKYRAFCELLGEKPTTVCIDVANGYTETFVKFVSKFREDNPDTVIMAGNVVTSEMTEQLIMAGADIVKVGIGSGSGCLTRRVAGVGRPQLSAIIECADAAHGVKGLICSDGGCVYPGDIAKAFAAGADFVMLGGMLAGHTECGGELLSREDGQYMKFYGMSSEEAMNKYHGGMAQHRASEGRVIEVPYRGSAEGTIQEILGGVRSACTYVGAEKLKELSKRATFYRVNRQLNDVFEKR